MHLPGKVNLRRESAVPHVRIMVSGGRGLRRRDCGCEPMLQALIGHSIRPHPSSEFVSLDMVSSRVVSILQLRISFGDKTTSAWSYVEQDKFCSGVYSKSFIRIKNTRVTQRFRAMYGNKYSRFSTENIPIRYHRVLFRRVHWWRPLNLRFCLQRVL